MPALSQRLNGRGSRWPCDSIERRFKYVELPATLE
jgi:hypothetical protein